MTLGVIEDFSEHLRPEELNHRAHYRRALDVHRNYCPFAHRRIKELKTYVENQFCPVGIEDAVTKIQCIKNDWYYGINGWESEDELFNWPQEEAGFAYMKAELIQQANTSTVPLLRKRQNLDDTSSESAISDRNDGEYVVQK